MQAMPTLSGGSPLAERWAFQVSNRSSIDLAQASASAASRVPGRGGVIALTVTLGLGLSATIHSLNRIMQDLESSQKPERAVELATVQMRPPLILTIVLLSCALTMTVLSNQPMLRLFCWLALSRCC